MHPISQQGNRFHFDAVIIGSGIAGLICALELARKSPDAKIALLAKKQLSESNSRYAQGGIATAHSKEDSVQSHVADTLIAGDGLCLTQVVEEITQAGQAGIDCLKRYGVQFNQTEGEPDLTMEGGHSQRRIFHHDDITGQEIIRALSDSLKENKQIECFEQHCAINLINRKPEHSPGKLNEVVGAYVLDEKIGLIHTFLAKVVILATGGAGKVYRYTTNSEVATGDGLAMAHRVGARLGNMEFYQFHPTLLYNPKNNHFLLSEALRGEGAYLRLPKTGERFMQRYAPEKMELATRDIVARAIFTELERSGSKFIHLDMRHKPRVFLTKRFPNIYYQLKNLGLDLHTDLIPTVPAAHYLCGGVLTNTAGETDLQRLFAIGEAAFTGFHGANRLASNSLLEGVVMGQQVASACLYWLDKPAEDLKQINDWQSHSVIDLRRASQINAHWRGLRGEMTSYAGIIRTEAGLKDLLKLVMARREMIEEYYWQYTITRDLIELRNIVLVAELIVRSALARQESRGGHYRADFPIRSEQAEESILPVHSHSLQPEMRS